MVITTSIFEGSYDFEMRLDEHKSNGESVFQLTLGDQILLVTRDEWKKLYHLVNNSMDFIDCNYE